MLNLVCGENRANKWILDIFSALGSSGVFGSKELVAASEKFTLQDRSCRVELERYLHAVRILSTACGGTIGDKVWDQV